jgi:ferredoxin
MTYKITIDDDKCIGCGACTQCENFELKEGKIMVKKIKIEELGCNKESVDICPVDAIKINKI